MKIKSQNACRSRKLARPDSRRPLYTLPKPPSPIRLASLKFWVAKASSLNVKLRATLPLWLLLSPPFPPKERPFIPFPKHEQKPIIQYNELKHHMIKLPISQIQLKSQTLLTTKYLTTLTFLESKEQILIYTHNIV